VSLVVVPEFVTSAAADLQSIGSALTEAHGAAALPTTGLAAAGADEVSAAVTSLFSNFGKEFQALSGQASLFHQQFVQTLQSGAGSYAATEAAAAAPLQTLEHDVVGVINAPANTLLGRPLIGNGGLLFGTHGTSGGAGASIAASTGGASTGGTGATTAVAPAVTAGTGAAPTSSNSVPITMVNTTEPIVHLSVGSGPTIPVLVDTGSTGLVIPFQDIGGLPGLLKLGLPTHFGVSGYSGGLNYVYATFNAPVNFGNGLVTAPTPVNVEFFAYPTTIQSLLSNGFSFQNFFAPDGAQGVLGLGPNSGGPGTSIPTQALPGDLGQGVLINETAAQPYLQFGPNPGTAIPGGTLTGAPITNLDVVVHNGATTTTYNGISSEIDSGGVYGTVPSSINAPAGSTVDVYAPGTEGTGTPLYSYTAGATNAPTPITSGEMNTGNAPFMHYPVYISYSPGGTGTTIFDSPIP
jgi:PE family